MITTLSMLHQADRLCGQFAAALHNCELQIYETDNLKG